MKTLIEEFPCNDRIEIESFSKSCEDCDEEKRRQKEEKYKKDNHKSSLYSFYKDIGEDRKYSSFFSSSDYYAVSNSWAKKWLTYVEFPNEPEPGKIQNNDLICEHNKFICYHEISDIERTFCIVSSSEWKTLKSR